MSCHRLLCVLASVKQMYETCGYIRMMHEWERHVQQRGVTRVTALVCMRPRQGVMFAARGGWGGRKGPGRGEGGCEGVGRGGVW